MFGTILNTSLVKPYCLIVVELLVCKESTSPKQGRNIDILFETN